MTFLGHAVLGGLGGLGNAALFATLRARDRGAPLAVALGIAAGIYIGFGLRDGRPSHVALQILGALPFIVVGAWWPQAVGLLGMAWIAHGLWDGMHALGLLDTRVPSWYPAGCLGWDVVLGAAALLWGRSAKLG